mmetsp:Transcript_22105/g.57690  ORF Transcript_22105/g.57690 Transcript_22105/m.57690 type:complete len:300 (+) Transcript_22105:449-1348(+)
MATGGMTVHLGLCLVPVAVPQAHSIHGVAHGRDGRLRDFGQVQRSRMLAHRRLDGGPPSRWRQQVEHGLVVDLNERGAQPHRALGSPVARATFGLEHAGVLQEGLQGPGNDAQVVGINLGLSAQRAGTIRAQHCVSLARASLPVGQDGAIVALEDSVHDAGGDCIVHLGLARLRSQHLVEAKGPVYRTSQRVCSQRARLSVLAELHARTSIGGTARLNLPSAEGPEADRDLDALALASLARRRGCPLLPLQDLVWPGRSRPAVPRGPRGRLARLARGRLCAGAGGHGERRARRVRRYGT